MIDVCNRYNANCKEQWPGGTFVYCQYSLLGPELRKSVSNIFVPPFLCIHLINVSCIAGVIHVYKSGFNKQCYWTQKQTLSPQTTSLNPKGPTLLHNQSSLFNRFPAKPPVHFVLGVTWSPAYLRQEDGSLHRNQYNLVLCGCKH